MSFFGFHGSFFVLAKRILNMCWVTMHVDGEGGCVHAHATIANHDARSGQVINKEGTSLYAPRVQAVNDRLSRENGFQVLGADKEMSTWAQRRDTPVCLLVLKTKRNGNSGNVLFIDASKEFKPGKNQNTLEDEHIQRIVDAYVKREDVDTFAHVADMAEIEANGWNLNIPRYVDTFEEEKPVDLEAVRDDLKRIESEKKVAIDKAESMLCQLGL